MDFEDCQLTIENLEFLFSEMYTYQTRPFLIVLVNFIYSFLNFLHFQILKNYLFILYLILR